MSDKPSHQLTLVRGDRSQGAWWKAVPGNAVLVASAPASLPPADGAVLPAARYGADQVLFGFDAQLRAFAQVMRAQGRALLVAPLPEMFATPKSLAALATGGAAPPLDIVHLRFGPARDARVLKGARNLMVLADDPLRAPIDAGDHPFASGHRLPGPFATLLTYAARRGPPPVAGGEELGAHVLGEEFVLADIACEAAPDAPDSFPAFASASPIRHAVTDLRVCSFAEYGGDAHAAAASPDWRRALALAAAAGDADPARRAGFVMVPWNLSDPASIIPDLARKLARRDPGENGGPGIVLFPFNATPTTGIPVADLVAAVRGIAGASGGAGAAALRGLFLARLTALRDAHRLRALFPLAWLEGDGAEADFCARRLAWLGIGIGLLGAGAGAGDTAARFSVAPDEPMRLRLSDCFGERAYATRTLSPRQLGALLARSRETLLAARPPGDDDAAARVAGPPRAGTP